MGLDNGGDSGWFKVKQSRDFLTTDTEEYLYLKKWTTGDLKLD